MAYTQSCSALSDSIPQHRLVIYADTRPHGHERLPHLLNVCVDGAVPLNELA
jgi:hypothetical protein